MRTSAVVAVALLLTGCGGGGGSDAVVSASPPAASPPAAATPSPATEPPATQPPAGQPPAAEPPAPQPPSPPPPPSSGEAESVPIASVIRALTTGSAQRAASADLADNTFTTVTKEAYGQTLSIAVQRTLFGTIDPQSEVRASVNAAISPSALTFNGSGQASGHSPGNYGYGDLVSNQHSLPASVPTNRTLHQWNLQAGGGFLRLILTTVADDLSIFRLCWNSEMFGNSGLACTRHRISDGEIVGMDASHDIGGVIARHQTNDDQPSPRSILLCEKSSYASGKLYEHLVGYSLFEFTPPVLYRDRAVLYNISQISNDEYSGHGTTDLGDGRSEETIGSMRGGTTFVHKGNRVERLDSSGGFLSDSYKEACK